MRFGFCNCKDNGLFLGGKKRIHLMCLKDVFFINQNIQDHKKDSDESNKKKLS